MTYFNNVTNVSPVQAASDAARKHVIVKSLLDAAGIMESMADQFIETVARFDPEYTSQAVPAPIKALDLFAGTGWGYAAQEMNIDDYGVEIMPEARATRAANGMKYAGFDDVWDGLIPNPNCPLPASLPHYDLLIASPPCQTFSAAGKGTGRKALDDVLRLVREIDTLQRHATPIEMALHLRDEAHHLGDDRTALVLTPLLYALRDRPKYIALEQVTAVLPVWKAIAEVLRKAGYYVEVDILNAEQYGVPQTRKRAILAAERADNYPPRPLLPVPTHSRYYPRDKARLDPDVLPWVSMADALGWGRTARPSVTVTGGGTAAGGAEPLAHWSREMAAEDFVMRSNYGTSGDPQNRGERSLEEPAPTMTSKANRNLWTAPAPAPTLDHAAEAEDAEHWTHHRPSTTVVGSSRPDVIAAPGYRTAGGPSRQNAPGSVRVSLEEAAALQTFPQDAIWRLTRSNGKLVPENNLFLQVGNAVPPLLAKAILGALVRPTLDADTEGVQP